jgi:iron complex transport system ATP-binding protein
MNHTIEGQSIKLGYGSKVIIPEMDIVIDKPEIISIIGPNGSGKWLRLTGWQRYSSTATGAGG